MSLLCDIIRTGTGYPPIQAPPGSSLFQNYYESIHQFSYVILAERFASSWDDDVVVGALAHDVVDVF